MELMLSENIRKFRKERKLTQEQFAEIFGVTPGAVYKWESKLSIPELSLIMEMADFFDTSVDVLLGYDVKDNNIRSTLKRLNNYINERNPDALIEAEKALKKYPNNFEIVDKAASVYQAFGAESHDHAKLERALELLERDLVLISQNTDPRRSELSIFSDMAVIYLEMGEDQKGLDILKKNNPEGVHSAAIGTTLALMKRLDEAEPFLSEAFIRGLTDLLDSASSYVFVLSSRKDYQSAHDVIKWGIDLFEGVRKENTVDFFDKTRVSLLLLLAYTELKCGRKDDAKRTVYEAYSSAQQFDYAPGYGLDSVRYITVPDDVIIHDNLGATAEQSAEKILSCIDDEEMNDLWKEVTHHG